MTSNRTMNDVAYSVVEATRDAGRRHPDATVEDILFGVAAAYKKICEMADVGEEVMHKLLDQVQGVKVSNG